jgi:alkylation response protein AidB-like acyl-CoA dehydrogenase
MDLLAHARLLAARLPAVAAAHEAERRLSPAVVDALRADGFLRILLPRELGGLELDAPAYVEVLAALAAGDAATAWCVMTASTSTLLAAYLDRAAAEAIWSAGPTPFLSGVFAPTGTATVDGDHLRVRGRWAYGSGCRHADWIAVGALADGGPRPRHVVCFLPVADPAVTIDEHWDTLGLGGTGSHDLVVTDGLVPAPLVASVFERPPWPAGALHRLPLFGLLATGIAACAIGVATAAVDHDAARLAATRPGAEPPPSAALASHAGLVARLGALRAYLVDVAGRAQRAVEGGPPPAATRGELRLAATHVAGECAAIVRAAFHQAGGAAIRTGHPLHRALRDVETMLTHRMVGERVLPAAARAVLGLGALPPDL